MSYFSKKLKQLRLFNDLFQKDVAADLGLPLTTYNSYEIGRNEPTYENLIKIAYYYDISIDELLGVSRPKNNISNLSAEEQELIKYFRQCDEFERTYILEKTKTIVNSEQNQQINRKKPQQPLKKA